MAMFGPKNGQKWFCPKMIPRALGRFTGHIWAVLGPVLTCLAPLKARLLRLMEPFGTVLTASGHAPQISDLGPKIEKSDFSQKCSLALWAGKRGMCRPIGAPFEGEGFELSTSRSG